LECLTVLALMIGIVNLALSLRRDSVRRAVEAELAAREQLFVNRMKGKVNQVRVDFGRPAVNITNLESLAEAYMTIVNPMASDPPGAQINPSLQRK